MAGNTPRLTGLGAEMRRAREDAKLSVRRMAAKLGIEPSTVSRWELGTRAPSPEHVAQYLAEVGAPSKQIAELVTHAYETNGSRWLAVGMPEQHRQMVSLLEVERTASHIVDVSPLLIPGLLQTGDYARAIMTTGGVPESEIDTRVAVRIGRREAITRARPAHLRAFVGEAALYQRIAEPEVMQYQFQFLLELNQRSNVELRLIPMRSGWHPGVDGPFLIDYFPDDGRTVVHLENRISGLFLHEPADVKVYEDAVEKICEVSMSPEESVRTITEFVV